MAPAGHAPATPKQAVPVENKTITIIDGSSGARRDVTVPSDGDAPAAPGTTAPTPTSPAPPVMANINPQLLENTRYGMVPVIASGLKSSQVYAAGNDAL